MNSYKEVFQALADGKEIEVKVLIGDAAQVWQTVTAFKVCELISTEFDVARFRIKPETVTINGRKVPKPETEAPKIGKIYYCASVFYEGGYDVSRWDGDTADERLLQRGLVHLTKEAAIAHAEALISFTGRP